MHHAVDITTRRARAADNMFASPLRQEQNQQHPLAEDRSQAAEQEAIWVRLTIEEGTYQPISVDKAALSLFADRLLIRVPETKFTITIYLRDVFKLEPFVERYELILHTGNFSHRRYVLSAYLPSTVPMLYEILSTRITERDTKFPADGSYSNSTKYAASSRTDFFGGAFAASEVSPIGPGYKSNGRPRALVDDYSLVHTPPANSSRQHRAQADDPGLPSSRSGSSAANAGGVPLHLRLSRVSVAAPGASSQRSASNSAWNQRHQLPSHAAFHGGVEAPPGQQYHHYHADASQTGNATDLSHLLALTKDARKPPHVAALPSQNGSYGDRSTSQSPPRHVSPQSLRKGPPLIAGGGTALRYQDEVVAPAPPIWLIQRNLSEIDSRDRALHHRDRVGGGVRSTELDRSSLWNGYHVENETGEFVFDTPPPDVFDQMKTQLHSIVSPRPSPPRANNNSPVRGGGGGGRVTHASTSWATALEESVPQVRGRSPTYASQSALREPSRDDAAHARDRLFATMVGGAPSVETGPSRTLATGPPPPSFRPATTAADGPTLSIEPSRLAPSRKPSSSSASATGQPVATFTSISAQVDAAREISDQTLPSPIPPNKYGTKSVAPPSARPLQQEQQQQQQPVREQRSQAGPQQPSSPSPNIVAIVTSSEPPPSSRPAPAEQSSSVFVVLDAPTLSGAASRTQEQTVNGTAQPTRPNPSSGGSATSSYSAAPIVERATQPATSGDQPSKPMWELMQAQHLRVMQELAQLQQAKAQGTSSAASVPVREDDVALSQQQQQQQQRQQPSAVKPTPVPDLPPRSPVLEDAVASTPSPRFATRPPLNRPPTHPADTRTSQQHPPLPPPAPTSWIGQPLIGAPSAQPQNQAPKSSGLPPPARAATPPRTSPVRTDLRVSGNVTSPVRSPSVDSTSSRGSAKIPPSRRPMDNSRAPSSGGPMAAFSGGDGGSLMRRSSSAAAGGSALSSRSGTPQSQQQQPGSYRGQGNTQSSSSQQRAAAPAARPQAKT